MEKKMDYILNGMRMVRRGLKQLTRMEIKMDYGLLGIRTDKK